MEGIWESWGKQGGRALFWLARATPHLRTPNLVRGEERRQERRKEKRRVKLRTLVDISEMDRQLF